MPKISLPALFILFLLGLANGVQADDPQAVAGNPLFTRTEDVIYGRKFGTALTMDVFTPRDANGMAIIWVVSGGWFSDHKLIKTPLYVTQGYTVFAVVHGSQPKFTIPEAIADINRAVRYIRYHAKDYKIDPDRIGIFGLSAGGHLALMQGTAGDLGDPKAQDPVERISSRVQTVACFYPPTDFLNYGDKGKNAFGPGGVLTNFQAAMDIREFDPRTKMLERVTNERIAELSRQISPITHVTADDPPTLIIHGDADTLVPIQQAEAIVAKFKAVGVAAQLVVKKGAGHGWLDMGQDLVTTINWFDTYLKKK